MVLISAASLFNENKSRGRLGSSGIQIARTPPWSKKAVCLRKAPFTIENPTPGQMHQRIAFGRLAQQGRGRGFDHAKGMPGVASFIQDNAASLRGNPHKRQGPARSQSFHTVAQLEGMLERALRTGYGSTPQAPADYF